MKATNNTITIATPPIGTSTDSCASRIAQRAEAIVAGTIGDLRTQIATHKRQCLAETQIPRDVVVHTNFTEHVDGPGFGLKLQDTLKSKIRQAIGKALTKDGHNVTAVEVYDHPKSIYVALWIDNVDPKASYAENQRRKAG